MKRYNALRNKLSEDLLCASALFGPSLRRVGATLAGINMDSSNPWRRDTLSGKWFLPEEEEAPVRCPAPATPCLERNAAGYLLHAGRYARAR